ncbi:MAG: hypothetical protein ABGZ17_18535, partial [Planctomycetaceae bacterium]
MHLRQAIVLHDGHDRAHNILGLVLAMQGHDIDAAREFYAAGLTAADITSNLGYVALRVGQETKAREMFAHTLQLDAQHALAEHYFKVLVPASQRSLQEPLDQEISQLQ